MDCSENYRIVPLVNGVRSVHCVALGETFHPVVGPILEADALYVRQLKLAERFRSEKEEFVVWDVGLGAAANVVAVLRAIQGSPGRFRLISFDQTLEPLRFALRHTVELGYFGEYEQVLRMLASGGTGPWTFQNGQHTVTWECHVANFPSLIQQPAAAGWAKPHAILFDAYSPATNPEMWTQPLFARLYQMLDPRRPCALPTYSRSTLLRVTLLLAGFFVGKGHATGEKEETTIAANCRELVADPLERRWLARVRASTSAEPLWEPVYRQLPLSAASWELLQKHPQFI